MSSSDDQGEMETKGVIASLIIEVLGRPPELLIETLNKLIKRMGEEKGVKVTSTKIHEPTIVKDKKNVYTGFAEIDVEVEEIIDLAILMFGYMPSHIEIISPGKLSLTSNSWCDVLNELVRRLHQYDEVAKVLQTEKLILENQLREILKKKSPEKKS